MQQRELRADMHVCVWAHTSMRLSSLCVCLALCLSSVNHPSIYALSIHLSSVCQSSVCASIYIYRLHQSSMQLPILSVCTDLCQSYE